MKRMAIINDGKVINIAEWDGISLWNPTCEQLVDVTNIECGIGYTYSNGIFTAPIE